MKAYHLVNKRRIQALSNNKKLQMFIVIVSWFLLGVYAIGYSLNFYNVVYILQNNTYYLQQNEDIRQQIQSYETNDEGVMTIELMNGKTFELISSEDYTISPALGLDDDETYWIEDEQVLVQRVSKDFGWNMLMGSKMYFVLAYSIMLFVILYVGRMNQMKILGKKSVSIVTILLVMYISLLATESVIYFK